MFWHEFASKHEKAQGSVEKPHDNVHVAVGDTKPAGAMTLVEWSAFDIVKYNLAAI